MPSPGDQTTGGQQTRRKRAQQGLSQGHFDRRATRKRARAGNCMRAGEGVPQSTLPALGVSSRKTAWRMPAEAYAATGQRGQMFSQLLHDKIPIINARQKETSSQE